MFCLLLKMLLMRQFEVLSDTLQVLIVLLIEKTVSSDTIAKFADYDHLSSPMSKKYLIDMIFKFRIVEKMFREFINKMKRNKYLIARH